MSLYLPILDIEILDDLTIVDMIKSTITFKYPAIDDVRELLALPLDEMPLYINELYPANVIAAWRLEHAK
jgi:hypothetical protein